MKSTVKKIKPKQSVCIACATKVLGDKWTPRIIFALSQKTSRFNQLQDQAGGVNPRTLSGRLANLEEEGIIKKKLFAEIPPRIEYTLTAKGRDLVPILRSMANWGEKYP